MRQRGLGAWGIQTGPFAALCTSHILKLFHLFHLHTGRPFLITPEGQLWEMEILPTQKLNGIVLTILQSALFRNMLNAAELCFPYLLSLFRIRRPATRRAPLLRAVSFMHRERAM